MKFQTKDLVVVLDPYSPDVGLPPFRAKADIVALTNPAAASSSHTESIQGDPIIINGPGEFSLSGSTLYAHPWRADDGSQRTIHRWRIEDLLILHLGALNRELTDDELQKIEQTDIDVLLVPVGGGSGLTTKQALSLISTLEPRVVIPIHYALPKEKEKLESVQQFAKEMGVSPSSAEQKIILKANKMPADEIITFLLKP